MRTSVLPVIALLMLPGIAGAASFIGLGDLPGGSFESYANGVSADGLVVVGRADGGTAFRWTLAGGMVNLGNLADGYGGGEAYGVSADGSVVVGLVNSARGSQAFRWTQGGGMVGLGDLPGYGFASTAYGVSADGSMVVGDGLSYYPQPFNWTQATGMVSLNFDRCCGLRARGVSADGSVVVGWREEAAATRWTQADGWVTLPVLPDAENPVSHANAISADGSVIVGDGAAPTGQQRAVRWTQSTGTVPLTDFFGPSGGSAYGVSADGSVIVGYHQLFEGKGSEAFLWTQASGIQSLFDVLVANGATGLTGWKLGVASGVSADGLTVVGWGVNPLGKNEAFVANLSAVPLPSAIWLLATGVAGLCGRRWLRGKETRTGSV